MTAPHSEPLPTDLTADEAKALTDALKSLRVGFGPFPVEHVLKAFHGRIWLARGYESWREWTRRETVSYNLPDPTWRYIVGDLHSAGMPDSAIADVTRVSIEDVSAETAKHA